MNDDFSTARPGDKLYSLRYGEVTVVSVQLDCGMYPVVACADKFRMAWHVNGFHRCVDKTQDLYWAKPEIVSPPKPKRMVERKYEFWVNVSPCRTLCVYDTKEMADKCASTDRLGEAEHIVRTVMVEEEECDA